LLICKYVLVRVFLLLSGYIEMSKPGQHIHVYQFRVFTGRFRYETWRSVIFFSFIFMENLMNCWYAGVIIMDKKKYLNA
ncbi:TPA: hypothetical protein ACPD32_002380, partial [Escherichia coli]